MDNSAHKVIIVDEQDTAVQYEGEWERLGAPREFRSTTSLAKKQEGTKVTFGFNGTTVSVYATISSSNSTMNFLLDGKITGSFNSSSILPTEAVWHHAIWTSPEVPAGMHSLVITPGPIQPQGGIYLDYFVYEPFPGLWKDVAYVVDDADPAAGIQYEKWDAGAAPVNMGNTLHTSGGEGAKVTYTFEGTQLEIFGNVPPQTAASHMAAISIDGGPPSSFLGQAGTEIGYGQSIFRSPTLSNGRHTVVLTATGTTPLSFDYFVVTPGPPTTSDTSTTTSSSSTGSPTSTPDPTAPPPAPANSSVNTKVVVGAVVGGVVFLFLIALFLLLWLKRRRSRAHAHRRHPSRTSLISRDSATVGHNTRAGEDAGEQGYLTTEVTSRGKSVVVLRPPSSPNVDSGYRFERGPPTYVSH